MKYAWIEETYEQEVLDSVPYDPPQYVDGDEIFDENGDPFDPPQYEQIEQFQEVPFDPPQYETIYTGDGAVTGLNRGAVEAGESEGTITPQHLIWGMETEAYSVKDYVFTPKTSEDMEEIEWQKESDSAISRIWAYHDSVINGYGWEDSVYQTKRGAKLGKAQRAEAKGTATPEQIQILDDNDALDTWLDDMETAAEGGVTWCEDQLRTIEELKAYDPEVDIVWPPYPFI